MFVSRNPLRSASIHARLGWQRLSRPAAPGAVVVIPPTHPNSLGDEAMVAASISCFRRQGRRVDVLTHDERHPWSLRLPEISEEAGYRNLGTRHRPKAILDLARKFRHATDAFLIGADVLDGGYGDWHVETKLDLLSVLQACGLRAHVAGFSFKAGASPGAVVAFAQLDARASITLRDPESHRRFQTATGRPAHLGADLAFLFETPPSPPPEAVWIAARRAAGSSLLGYNLNGYLHRYLPGLGLRGYLEAHVTLLSALLDSRPDLSVALVPHDNLRYDKTEHDSDPDMAAALGDALAPRFGERVRALPLPSSAASVAGLCSQLDVAISGRMHFGIACLRAGVPVACWEYQNKVEGLLAGHFGIPEAVLPLDALKDVGALFRRLDQWIGAHDATRRQVAERLPAVQALARMNFQGIGAEGSNGASGG
jgi:polysaccharide pyruvyl transferase WcaK-like protein